VSSAAKEAVFAKFPQRIRKLIFSQTLSLKKKHLKAAWNDDFRGKVLFA
jgi:hypothetical protein